MTVSHLQARRREGMRQRTAPTEKAAGEAGWVGGGEARLQCNLKKVSGMLRGGPKIWGRPCPLDPWTLSHLRSRDGWGSQVMAF